MTGTTTTHSSAPYGPRGLESHVDDPVTRPRRPTNPRCQNGVSRRLPSQDVPRFDFLQCGEGRGRTTGTGPELYTTYERCTKVNWECGGTLSVTKVDVKFLFFQI